MVTLQYIKTSDNIKQIELYIIIIISLYNNNNNNNNKNKIDWILERLKPMSPPERRQGGLHLRGQRGHAPPAETLQCGWSRPSQPPPTPPLWVLVVPV